MSDKKFEIPLPDGGRIANMSLADVEGLRAQCERVLAQAEAEKPKAWDFGPHQNGVLAIKQPHGWASWGPDTRAAEGDVRILGNLKDIVENQGPIVVGMTKCQATPCAAVLDHHGGAATHSAWRVALRKVSERINAALACYESQK